MILSPFPAEQLKKALTGVTKVISVEENAMAQLAVLAEHHGVMPGKNILQFDGRPFLPDDLLVRVQEIII